MVTVSLYFRTDGEKTKKKKKKGKDKEEDEDDKNKLPPVPFFQMVG